MTAALTAVLVVVTAYYAWQTYQMVVEMRRDRRERAMPRVVLDLRSEGVGFVPPSVCNVGLGPALDLDVKMTYVPRNGASLTGVDFTTRRWRSRLVASGERARFLPPTDAVGQPLHMDRVAELFRAVRLEGTCQASVGEPVTIDEEVGDLAELWELAKGSWHLVDDEPDKRIVNELKEIRKVLAKLVPKSDPDERRRSIEASKAFLEESLPCDGGKPGAETGKATSGPKRDEDAAGVDDTAWTDSAPDDQRSA